MNCLLTSALHTAEDALLERIVPFSVGSALLCLLEVAFAIGEIHLQSVLTSFTVNSRKGVLVRVLLAIRVYSEAIETRFVLGLPPFTEVYFIRNSTLDNGKIACRTSQG